MSAPATISESQRLDALPTGSLIKYLLDDHDYIWARLPFLAPMAARLARTCPGAGERCTELAGLVGDLHRLVLDHLAVEERILSGISDAREPDLVLDRVAGLHREHLAIQALLESVEHAADLPRTPRPCGAMDAFAGELRRIGDHVRSQIQIEEEILAPRLTHPAPP